MSNFAPVANSVPPFTISEARYCQNSIVVRVASDGSGWKHRVHWLCEALKMRWSHRQHGYVGSPSKGRRLAELYAAGWTAGLSGKLIPPQDADHGCSSSLSGVPQHQTPFTNTSLFPPLEHNKMKRRFEFIGGASAKFYEVNVDECHVTTRYGRIGNEGQTQTKSFSDKTAAAKHAEKVMLEKLAKGYTEA